MTDDDVLEAMDRFGGSFVQALAACFRRADDENRRVLKGAFRAYWVQYADLAERPRGPKPTFPANMVTISDQPVKESKR